MKEEAMLVLSALMDGEEVTDRAATQGWSHKGLHIHELNVLELKTAGDVILGSR
jgi:hypothetical protein